jgi:hypothetical protein
MHVFTSQKTPGQNSNWMQRYKTTYITRNDELDKTTTHSRAETKPTRKGKKIHKRRECRRKDHSDSLTTNNMKPKTKYKGKTNLSNHHRHSITNRTPLISKTSLGRDWSAMD